MNESSRVAPHLYVGSAPSPGRVIDANLLVLCAKEWQPTGFSIPTLHAPFNDDGSAMTEAEEAIALRAAKVAAEILSAGQRVLVTCWQGRNRSGLVAALALLRLHSGMSADEAIWLVRSARGPHALSNPDFVKLIRRQRRSAVLVWRP